MEAARVSFEESNDIRSVQSVDSIFRYNHAQQQELLASKPWEKEYVTCQEHNTHIQKTQQPFLMFVFNALPLVRTTLRMSRFLLWHC